MSFQTSSRPEALGVSYRVLSFGESTMKDPGSLQVFGVENTSLSRLLSTADVYVATAVRLV